MLIIYLSGDVYTVPETTFLHLVETEVRATKQLRVVATTMRKKFSPFSIVQ